MLAAFVVAAASSPAPAIHAQAQNHRAIAIVINGNPLPIDPAPRFDKNVLFVPVRRTLLALGLPFNRYGNRLVTQVGSKTATLVVGSRTATIDADQIQLDQPVSETKGILYAPLRFFTDVLGAQATYDRRSNTVNIVAQLAGRSDAGLMVTGSGYTRVGTVAAVDVLSNPPTLTFGYFSGPKTVSIAPNAAIDVENVDADVTTPGELGDVRPGDFARVEMRKDGRVERVVDAYGSHDGRIVAAAGNQFVLDTGQVVSPGRAVEVSLNGAAAGFSDLRPGDRVSVRYNVETNEVREILASRQIGGSPSQNGLSVSTDATRPLRAGERLRVTMHGPPNGSATFDIGSYVADQVMRESPAGTYDGDYTIPGGANFDSVPVIGRLRVASGTLQAQASDLVSASSVPPGVSDFGPDNGDVVNDNRPSMYATFNSDAVAVNPSSVQIVVNGHDVTSDSVRTPQFVQYVPAFGYPDGPVRVTVRVADGAGNVTTKSWSFVIRTR
ncbi:MAG TPA: copper amine oxidase N-terminal domain-containing protein [Candidatus Tumulicola sp.]